MNTNKESQTELQKKEILRMNNKESNQLTRECLQLSLMHLMSDQPYEKITVSEIVRRAGVSRMAFYRNYTDKEDILHELGNKLVESIARIRRKLQHKYEDLRPEEKYLIERQRAEKEYLLYARDKKRNCLSLINFRIGINM